MRKPRKPSRKKIEESIEWEGTIPDLARKILELEKEGMTEFDLFDNDENYILCYERDETSSEFAKRFIDYSKRMKKYKEEQNSSQENSIQKAKKKYPFLRVKPPKGVKKAPKKYPKKKKNTSLV